MKLMNRALASDEGTTDYLRDFVFAWRDLESYLDLIGRERIETLRETPNAFLLDPYRRWILPHVDAAALAFEVET
jgi:glutaconate CoA-transferase subunit A